MDGDEESGAHRSEHLQQLGTLCVPGHVHVANLGIKDPRSMPVEVVNGLMDHPLVARDGSRRDDDPIVLANVEERMALSRKAGQGGQRLALTPSRQQEQL